MNTINDSREQVFATVKAWKIDQKKVYDMKCKVDTGAEGNIMPISYYRKLYPENLDLNGNPESGTLDTSSVILSAYGGSTIKNLGTAKIPCSYKDTKFTCTFFVADVPGTIILGLKTSRALKLVTLHCAIEKIARSGRASPDHSEPQVSRQKSQSKQKRVNFEDDAHVKSEQSRETAHSPKVQYIPWDTPLKDRPYPLSTNVQDLKIMYPECYGMAGDMDDNRHIYTDKNVEPRIHAPRRIPIEKQEQLKHQLEEMVEEEIITKVTGPTDWVNSMVLREKPDGRLRVCLDPTDLNRAIKREHYPSRTVEEVSHKFAGAKVFSKLDARNGYWNVKLDEESSFLTTFNTPFGRYKFLRLPFGLKVSQDIFQCLMDYAYRDCRGAVNIADDIIVHGIDDYDHDLNMHDAMEKTRRAGVKLNEKEEKCQIKRKSVKFYGSVYTVDGVKPDPNRVESIQAIEAPKNKTDLHTFLGMVTYMSPFLPNLSDHTATLRELLRRDVEFQWTDSHDLAFDKVKQLLSKDVVLNYYDRKKPVTIQVDASGKGLGAALLQDERPIAYASKALTATETRYANIERELLAVVFGCTKFHTYLYGRAFTVQSDHKPLEQIQKKNLADAPPRLQRMLLKIQPYDVTIVYKPGKEVVIADALSRLNPVESDAIPGMEVRIHDITDITPIRLDELQQATAHDDTLQVLQQQIIVGWPTTIKKLTPQLRPYWSVRDSLAIQDSLVIMGQRIIIPESLRPSMLKQLHSGHQGMEKLKLRAKGTIYWPGIYKAIEQLVAACPTCQEFQNSQCKEPMIPSEIPPRQWHTVGGDLFFFEQKWFLLVTDYYSKFPFVRKLSNLTAKCVIDAFKNILSEQGVPAKLICDNGKQFDAHEFRQFAEKYGFEVVTSSPHYPRGHGLIERHVETIKSAMAKSRHDGSDVYLTLLSLRSTPLNHTLPSPAELLNGRIYKCNLPVRIPPPLGHERVAEQFRQRQRVGAEHYDQHAKSMPELLPGQQVRLQDPVKKTWQPARVIEEAKTPRSYTIERDDGKQLRRNRLHLRTTGETEPVTPEKPVAGPVSPARTTPHHTRPPNVVSPTKTSRS